MNSFCIFLLMSRFWEAAAASLSRWKLGFHNILVFQLQLVDDEGAAAVVHHKECLHINRRFLNIQINLVVKITSMTTGVGGLSAAWSVWWCLELHVPAASSPGCFLL